MLEISRTNVYSMEPQAWKRARHENLGKALHDWCQFARKHAGASFTLLSSTLAQGSRDSRGADRRRLAKLPAEEDYEEAREGEGQVASTAALTDMGTAVDMRTDLRTGMALQTAMDLTVAAPRPGVQL